MSSEPEMSCRASIPRAGQPEPIGLFIGYFPTQRTGQTIHSPKTLPAWRWLGL